MDQLRFLRFPLGNHYQLYQYKKMRQKTGEEIGVKRLKIEPTAKFCIEAQEEMDKNADLEEDE